MNPLEKLRRHRLLARTPTLTASSPDGQLVQAVGSPGTELEFAL